MVFISKPFRSLQELALWKQTDEFTFYNRATIDLKERNSTDGIQVILCHDMMGGYIEDNLVQESSTSLVYYTEYWTFIDIFIYFSHHLITIPPPGWVSAAHLHGVKVLGTVITEHQQGIRLNEELVFGPTLSDEMDTFYADRLVELAVALNFDGWFINIESPCSPRTAHAMVQFLQYLTIRMHEAKPNSLVIWYDSLTITGEIRWQDHLNELNKPFFEACDGIFTNYTWKESFPSKSASHALSRNRQVYTGIDIWGRNTFGGGKFDSHKALKVIKEALTSCAIFAPAWTYEAIPESERTVIKFKEREIKFWIGDETERSIAHYIEERELPKSDHFETNTCPCRGSKYVLPDGTIVYNDWSDLSLQSVMTSFKGNRGKHIKLSDNEEKAYFGSQSIQIEVNTSRNTGQVESYYIPLYKTHLQNPKWWKLAVDGPIGLLLTLGDGKKILMAAQDYSHPEVVKPYRETMNRNWIEFSFESPVASIVKEIGLYLETSEHAVVNFGFLSGYNSQPSPVDVCNLNFDVASDGSYTLKWDKVDHAHYAIYCDEKVVAVTIRNFYNTLEKGVYLVRGILNGEIQNLDEAAVIIVE